MIKKANEKNLKKLYERCKPAMQKKFGRVLTYEEFVATMAYAYKKGMV